MAASSWSREKRWRSGQWPKEATGSPTGSVGVVHTLFGESYLRLNKQPRGGSAGPCLLQPGNTCQSALSDSQWLAEQQHLCALPSGAEASQDFNEDGQEVRGRKAGAGNDHI